MKFTFTLWVSEVEEQHFRDNPDNKLKALNHLAVGCETLGLPADRGEIRREDTNQLVERD